MSEKKLINRDKIYVVRDVKCQHFLEAAHLGESRYYLPIANQV
jgi:hypothetical protein